MAKTREQYVAEALHEIEQATWTPTKWAEAIENGYPPGTPYKYEGTHNFKAQQALWNAVHPPTNPAPPQPNPQPPSSLPSGNRCLYFSTVDQPTVDWVRSLGRFGRNLYTALFSADLNLGHPGGPYWATDAQVAQLTNAGIIVASWSDCSATPYSHAVELAKRSGFSFAGGQAEDTAQYVDAMSGNCTHIIGNPSNLNDTTLNDARTRTAQGTLRFIGEVLHPDPGYSAQGVNISSACMYVDMDEAHGGYQPLATFNVMPEGLKKGASIYTPGRMQADDRLVYEQWTRP